MVGHGGSSAGSYLADPTSPIPSHCASIVVMSTLRVDKTCVFIIRDIAIDPVIDTWQKNISVNIYHMLILFVCQQLFSVNKQG